MKKLMLSVFLVLTWAFSSFAQGTPKYEISAGFSNLRDSQIFNTQNSPGWYASISRNLTDWFALEAEFSGHYSRHEEPFGTSIFGCLNNPQVGNLGCARVRTSDHLFLGGPRFSYRGIDHITLFAHGLIGARYHESSDTIPSATSPVGLSSKFVHTSLAVGTGGGVDIGITREFAIRAIQADYVHSEAGASQPTNDLRLSSGVVFRFGSK